VNAALDALALAAVSGRGEKGGGRVAVSMTRAGILSYRLFVAELGGDAIEARGERVSAELRQHTAVEQNADHLGAGIVQ
jgi:hypothetical protein